MIFRRNLEKVHSARRRTLHSLYLASLPSPLHLPSLLSTLSNPSSFASFTSLYSRVEWKVLLGMPHPLSRTRHRIPSSLFSLFSLQPSPSSALKFTPNPFPALFHKQRERERENTRSLLPPYRRNERKHNIITIFQVSFSYELERGHNVAMDWGSFVCHSHCFTRKRFAVRCALFGSTKLFRAFHAREDTVECAYLRGWTFAKWSRATEMRIRWELSWMLERLSQRKAS